MKQYWSEGTSWDTVRDTCDLTTSGDLDTTQLDILTDMVAKRVKEKSSHGTD